MMNIEWNLSCSKSDALEIINNSLDKTSLIGWYQIHGKINGGTFKIWTKTPIMRGKNIAIGKGIIIEKEKGVSSLKASVSFVWPFSYFRFSSITTAAIIFIAVISWGLTIVGGIFQKHEILATIFFPIGCLSVVLIFLSYIRYLGEDEKNDLNKFLKDIFSSYIQ